MTALFSNPSKPPAQIIPAPAPMKSDAEVQNEANSERQRLAMASGRGGTILTGADSAPTPTPVKTLLGTG